MKRYVTLLALMFSLFFAQTAAATELVVNGGFETGDFTGWTQSGDLSYTSVTSDPTYVHSGIYAAQMGPVDSNGFLSQTLPTIAGQIYFVDFWLYNGQNVTGQSTPNNFTVLWEGVDVGPSLVNSASFLYTEIYGYIQATNNGSTFSFQFKHIPDYWGLDDVSVKDNAAVPLPSALLLLGSGLLGLAGWRRFRKG